MTSYFEYNARKPEADLIEPDETLRDNGITVEHGRLTDEFRELLENEFAKALEKAK